MTAVETQNALFPKLTDEQIECLRPHGVYLEAAPGDVVFRENERSESFFILLEGQLRVSRQINGQDAFIAMHEAGAFTGELAVLTRGENLATGTATVPCKLLKIDFFKAMHDVSGACPELMAIVIPALAQRRPAVMVLENQREKLASLGVLAAGLAHELNNPASAARRSAAQLREHLNAQWESAIGLCQAGVGPEGLHTLINVLEEVVVRPKPDLAPLERSDLETEIAERLEEIGMPEAWDVAASLADSGIQTADIHRIVMACSCDGLAAGLRWISEALVLSDLSAEIEDAASRIAELVATVKDYSSMDQAPSQEVDVRQGLISTLKILGHKIREKNIQVVKEFDPAVPSIVAIPGELNQVWTNLIANAIDAMSPGGTLSLRTAPEGPCILVEIGDTGTGIPDEIRNRIFDPFFTTKPVGQGTGLGLDVAYKIVVDHHGGSLRFRSRPGETVFEVRLPPGP